MNPEARTINEQWAYDQGWREGFKAGLEAANKMLEGMNEPLLDLKKVEDDEES